MAGKYLVIFACILLCATSIEALQTVNGTIKITVGTTAGCIFTVRFIHDHLVDTYAKYQDFLELEFVPWGRTVWNADDTFTCQFNPHNCWANRLHRCALNMLRNDQAAQLSYMACEFTSPSPSFNEGSYYCANEAGLNLIDVDYCVNNPRDELDRAAQTSGTAILSVINAVPAVVFNDDIDLERHREAIARLESLICFALADDPSTGVTNCEFNLLK